MLARLDALIGRWSNCEIAAGGLRGDGKDGAIPEVATAGCRAVQYAAFSENKACLWSGAVAAARKII